MGNLHSCLSIPSFHSCRRSSERSVNNNALNLNRVSEDELLFLPGITRVIAQNLIEYRQRADGFKQIEEILQVTGMTVRVFKHIRSDISLGLSSKPLSSSEPINLNLASHDELCSLPGLSPILVQRILQRRRRNGTFRFIEDLLQVKGIDYGILARLRPHVTVEQQRRPVIPQDTLSLASFLLETLSPDVQTLLLSSIPRQPSVKDPLTGFRFASWTLQQLSVEKVKNPGVREVICRVILDHNFVLIGIQDIDSKEALDGLVKELNHPTIPALKDVSTRPGRRWKSVISDVTRPLDGVEHHDFEYLGFIYDESIGIELKHASLLPLETHFTRLPFVAVFRLSEKFDVVFVNLHLEARSSEEDEVASFSALAQTIDEIFEQKAVILFGDFDLPATSPVFQPLIDHDYSPVLEDNTSSKTSSTSICLDNIWLSASAKTLLGHSGVVRDRLSSVWIPSGWSWGGLVSDHCPVWTELNVS